MIKLDNIWTLLTVTQIPLNWAFFNNPWNTSTCIQTFMASLINKVDTSVGKREKTIAKCRRKTKLQKQHYKKHWWIWMSFCFIYYAYNSLTAPGASQLLFSKWWDIEHKNLRRYQVVFIFIRYIYLHIHPKIKLTSFCSLIT